MFTYSIYLYEAVLHFYQSLNLCSGFKKQKEIPIGDKIFSYIPSSWVKIGWHIKNQLPGIPEVGEKQCTEREERKKGSNC